MDENRQEQSPQTGEGGQVQDTVSVPVQPKGAKERFYDKLPFTYKQVDIFVKFLMVLLAVLIAVGVATGSR